MHLKVKCYRSHMHVARDIIDVKLCIREVLKESTLHSGDTDPQITWLVQDVTAYKQTHVGRYFCLVLIDKV